MAVPSTTPTRTFTDKQLGELMPLIGDSDSVELKVSVPEEQHRSTTLALGLDPLEAQIRQVYFFDTPDLALDQAGVVVRCRRVQGKGEDTVVKLRPVVPSELPAELRQSASFRVEVDALPGGYVCSATMKGAARPGNVNEVVRGERPIRKLFSKDQRAFYKEHAPAGLGLDDLTMLGPIFVLKLALRPPELKQRLVAEMWLYPDGSRVLELSARTLTTDAFQGAAELRAYLSGHGIDLGGEQATKTRKALEYFSSVAKAPA